MIKKYIYNSLIAIFVLLSTQSFASHVAGGNLTYECIGGNNYRVTLEFRRDCFNGNPLAQFDDPASIGIFDSFGNMMNDLGSGGQLFINFNAADTLNEILTSECKIQGDDVCVETTTYVGTVTLPFNSDGYILAYQRCCRNITLNNIIEPNFQGSTYWTEINAEAQQVCNSSPTFNDWPSVYICANEDLVFDHSASDEDGDSLVYSLCVPSIGATFDFPNPQPPSAPPYGTVVWQPPYNLNDMMGGTALTIDPQTGIITANPNLVGQFLIGICVEEYRDGELLGFTRRDFEYNVRICDPHPIVDIIADPNPNCGGLEVNFEGEILPASTIFEWHFDYPNSGPSNFNELTPTHTFPSSGFYDVALIGQDGNCVDTFITEIYVAEPGFENINITGPDFVCGDDFDLNATGEQGDLFEWFADTDLTISLGTGNDINLPFLGAQTIYVVQTNALCPEFDSISIIGEQIDVTVDLPPASTLCIDEDYTIVVTNNDPSVDIELNWDTNGTLVTTQGESPATFEFEDPGMYEITLTITSDNGCVEEQNFTVSVSDVPGIDLEETYNVCYGDDLTLNPGGDPDFTYSWSTNIPGVTIDEDAVSPILENLQASGMVFLDLFLNGNEACSEEYEYQVNVTPEIELSYEGETMFCSFSDVVLEASANQMGEFLWTIVQTGETISGSTFEYFANENLTVLLTFTNEIGCEEEIEIPIVVREELELTIESSTGEIFCEGEDITFTAIYNGQGMVTWFDENGNEIGTGDNINVNPSGNTTYSAVVEDGDCVDEASYDLIISFVDISLIYPDVICEDGPIIIEVINNGFGTLTYTYDVDGEITETGDNQIEVTLDGNVSGTVTAVNEDGCEDQESFSINYSVISGLDVTADPDTININESTTLDTNLGDDVTYQWEPTETLDDPTSDMPVATPTDASTIYSVTVTNADGCTGTGEVEVIARIPQCNTEDVFVPNMFTPNGDGLNDVFMVHSIFVDEMNMVIFNRWGQKVFETSTVGSGWDGTFDGEELDPDVYAYCINVICINGLDYTATGNVTLLK